MKLVEILQGANVALAVLRTRLIEILCMTMTFAMFSWAMWLQTIMAGIIAATWGLTIFLPVLFAGRRAIDEKASHDDEAPPPGS